MAKSSPKNAVNRLFKLPLSTVTFVKEARQELKKVTWPNRQTTTRYTIIIVIASLSVGFVIGGVDYLFSLFIERII